MDGGHREAMTAIADKSMMGMLTRQDDIHAARNRSVDPGERNADVDALNAGTLPRRARTWGLVGVTCMEWPPWWWPDRRQLVVEPNPGDWPCVCRVTKSRNHLIVRSLIKFRR